VDESGVVGVLVPEDLGRALAEGAVEDDAVGTLPARIPVLAKPYQSGAEALRLLEHSGSRALVVTDDDGGFLGVVDAADLVAGRWGGFRPRLVGGMATPFGVYLTNGVVRAGAGSFALVTTGIALFAAFLLANLAAMSVAEALAIGEGPAAALALGLFLLTIRLAPLSGTHAAEHMVVHAIERGEDLTPAIVARMPRVHPRCGTNIATGMGIFLALAMGLPIESEPARLTIAVLVAAVSWRPVGSLMQRFVTTKRPSPRQIDDGIRAGTELLRRHQSDGHGAPSLPQRIWNMGVIQIMTGSLIASLIAEGLARVLAPGLFRVF
jgi:hypothetical protein